MEYTQPAFSLEACQLLLRRTPAILRATLAGLPPEWLYCNEGAETWSAFDVLGHLIHGEKTDWIERLQRVLEHGEDRPFEPFDRTAMFRDSAGRSAAELLDEFEALRTGNLRRLAELKLQPEQLSLRGMHPALGSVTLRELLATWAAHDLGHLVQINRVLARQLRQEVGPWREYLSVMA